MVGTFTVDLRDGRSVPFDEIVVLERKNGTWIRCIRDEPSRREQLPETTKYYRLETDVERIVIEPNGESYETSLSPGAEADAPDGVVALLEEADEELADDETVQRLLE
ncbi:hypothetical protein C491_17999 [Natronococcus amylolyticus DSM 10524]|uniref:Uncharacterized protein n=1 Tax=Natronococcus amylolyticus DSM 10524 TaxID=1227497 RepID=L9WYH6_9EURY|nr:hypothetical protein [Natronococcus amylolyticus]ELY54520.1 hypothetical protein C491_17999 [Natronococcus amylolyticus DSM 10524]